MILVKPYGKERFFLPTKIKQFEPGLYLDGWPSKNIKECLQWVPLRYTQNNLITVFSKGILVWSKHKLSQLEFELNLLIPFSLSLTFRPPSPLKHFQTKTHLLLIIQKTNSNSATFWGILTFKEKQCSQNNWNKNLLNFWWQFMTVHCCWSYGTNFYTKTFWRHSWCKKKTKKNKYH